VQKSDAVRIAAVMGVCGAQERFEVQPQEINGWFGATATGDFGQVEGWIRTADVDTVPEGFAGPAPQGRVDICGRSRDGEVCRV
jgi:hypothetical protein